MSIEWIECNESQQWYTEVEAGQFWVSGDGDKEKLEFVGQFGADEVIFEGSCRECKIAAEFYIIEVLGV